MNTSKEYRLLVVEDNEDTLFLIQYMLQSSFELICATSMDAALELAAENDIDLFLLDISLPGMKSGLDLLSRLRDQAAYKNTPALALTAHALPGDRERFLEQGFDGYVSKPFDREELVRTIRGVLPAINLNVDPVNGS